MVSVGWGGGWEAGMFCSKNKHLVLSVSHWSPLGSKFTNLPETESGLISGSDQTARAIHSCILISYGWQANEMYLNFVLF